GLSKASCNGGEDPLLDIVHMDFASIARYNNDEMYRYMLTCRSTKQRLIPKRIGGVPTVQVEVRTRYGYTCSSRRTKSANLVRSPASDLFQGRASAEFRCKLRYGPHPLRQPCGRLKDAIAFAVAPTRRVYLVRSHACAARTA